MPRPSGTEIGAGLSDTGRPRLVERARRVRAANGGASLVPRAGEGDAPLSSNQLRLWYLDQFEDGGAAHMISAAYRLRGALDAAALERALNVLLVRHEALRLQILDVEGRPLQHDSRLTHVDLPVVEVAGIDQGAREAELGERLSAFCRRRISLGEAPLFRTVLFKLGDEEHVFALVVHHIVFDGWSLDLFLTELASAYTTIVAGAAPRLAPPSIQYSDYAVWQRERASSPDVTGQLEFWQKHLRGPLPVLELPTDRPRPSEQSFEGGSLRWHIATERVERLGEVARTENATPFMVLLAAFDVLLHRYSGQPDLVVGVPVAGRERPEVHGTLGFFANTIALRASLGGNPSFRELLAQVRDTCLEGFEHAEVPFDVVVERLRPPRDLSRTPVYQAMFSYEERRGAAYAFGTLDVSSIDVPLEAARTDLTWWLESSEGGLDIVAEYASGLFDADTMARMLRHYDRLLSRVCAAPEVGIDDLSILDETDHACLARWNETARPRESSRSLVGWLSADWTARGNESAVVAGSTVLSYRGLEARSTRLAYHLRQAGVGPGSLVGLCLDRSVELLVAAVAIWKAGGAYVPLDPAYPVARLRFMVETSGLDVIVTEAVRGEALAFFEGRLVEVDREAAAIAQAPADPLDVPVGQEAPAYVIFTSGSTGEPKGVVVPQRAVVNFLASMVEEPGFASGDRLLAVTTLSFDISVLELFLPLLVGGTVVVAARDDVTDAGRLLSLMEEQRIDVMQATPSLWRMLLASEWRGDPGFRALCGGETLSPDLARALRSRVGELWNLYGPTETTVWSACERVERVRGPVPIGHPIANTRCYVLDPGMRPVPIGVAGELYVGGAGLALGYLGRADLTSECFVDDPFAKEDGSRLYRTGDRARWLASGRIEFLGRLDRQVKLRGHRVELNEVEGALAAHPAVQDCALTVWEDRPGDQRLVAYAVLDDASDLTVTEMRSWLREALPDYMIPQQLVQMDALPRTPNGKVDRRGLPAPGLVAAGAGSAPVLPRTPAQRVLTELWGELLGVERVGIHDSFFDLGGHSLLAAEAAARLRVEYGVVVPLRAFVLDPLERIAETHLDGLLDPPTRRTGRPSLMNRLFSRLGKEPH